VTIVRIGATKKYSDNWESAFGKKRSAQGSAKAATAVKKAPAKKSAKKSAKKR
jgi:hypothetical protein